jgi:hypothetical protein
MTDRKTAETATRQQGQGRDIGAEDGIAHTELRAAGGKIRPRSKVMPDEVGNDDDDMFNDMPV